MLVGILMMKIVLNKAKTNELRNLVWRATRMRKAMFRMKKLDSTMWQLPQWSKDE
jgi:hypothetical protein